MSFINMAIFFIAPVSVLVGMAILVLVFITGIWFWIATSVWVILLLAYILTIFIFSNLHIA